MDPSPTLISDTNRIACCLGILKATANREELILGYSTNPVIAISVSRRLESEHIRLLWHPTQSFSKTLPGQRDSCTRKCSTTPINNLSEDSCRTILLTFTSTSLENYI
jgi:hypothetical protein